jgi:phosphatidylserine/phosphatidylglycerophosphate/cardiolipin synthase-like enzyme
MSFVTLHPGPEPAARLLEAFATLGVGEWTPEHLCAAATVGMTPGDAVQILSGLSLVGVCDRMETEEAWRSPLSTTELRRLAVLLRGADHYRRLRLDPSTVSLAVTMPASPSRLAAELPALPGAPGGLLSTAEAFLRAAQGAAERLVVMTPFIDQRGFEWLRALLASVNTSVEKILILRNVEAYAAEIAAHHRAWLRELSVSVRDYYLPHDLDAGRSLPIETFHAKIVLADDRLAYVGSANMLGSGDGPSLEAGVLVGGPAAYHIAGLVAGVLRVARRL